MGRAENFRETLPLSALILILPKEVPMPIAENPFANHALGIPPRRRGVPSSMVS